MNEYGTSLTKLLYEDWGSSDRYGEPPPIISPLRFYKASVD